MHATAQRQAAALTMVTIVLMAMLGFLTSVAAPAQADPTGPVRAAPAPSTQPTSSPSPSVDVDAPVVRDIPVVTMRAISNVDTYTGPGTRYDRAGTVLAGADVQVDGTTDDGWFRLTDGRFVKGTFLEVPEPEMAGVTARTPMWVTATVTARTGPGPEHDPAGSLAAGAEVQVDGWTASGWYRLTDGRFVAGTYLSAWAPVEVPAAYDEQRRLAEAEASRFGVTIRWTDLPGNTAGAWTSMARDTIGVDTAALAEDVAILVVRHETAHRAIDSTCSTATPPIAGDRYENVTDAYADLFHGGMNGFVGPDLGGVRAQVGYGQPTQSDYDIAQAIRSGRCS